ncbi:hypothetical protein P4O66_022937 [Electrophorus voltai]|uniref:RAVE complex protein Rav1 C-terminal domain-containing protein n=1 Tax=Electrophorus voltai TaxID=2609070 RepID=A0AAD8ZKT7_9TELE|nr:hypothetical protein P4O66_022937 [Electrophorus voltai]
MASWLPSLCKALQLWLGPELGGALACHVWRALAQLFRKRAQLTGMGFPDTATPFPPADLLFPQLQDAARPTLCAGPGSWVRRCGREAYASGCDIVILGSDFERLQIIPGAKHGNIQVGCVDCSQQGGQIAASYGNIICIFEPVQISPKEKTQTKLNYHWQKTGQFVLQSIAHNLAWSPTGTSLLTGSTCLQLWSNVNFCFDAEWKCSSDPLCSWRCIWQCKTASPIHLLKFSPGGEFFATAGQDDCLVKVWYSTSKWQWDSPKLFTPPELTSQGEVNFSFIYLTHPRSVTGFSWRKTSKFMPRGAVGNVLLTCCKDSVCRLWAETLLPSDCLLSGLRYSPGSNNTGNTLKSASVKKAQCNNKGQSPKPLELNLAEPWGVSVRCTAQLAHTGPLPQQQNKHYAHRASAPHANALCHFHIAASINPATDIPLLPSISSLSGSDEEEPGGPFTVHWLNNKELHLTLTMEVFLQQLRGTLEQHNPPHTAQANGATEYDEEGNVASPEGRKGEQSADAASGPLPAAAVEHQVDVLLGDWNKAADMLYSIHPMDGSLLVWHVDWLDEYQPGMFRQVQVSFASRIPVAFPTGDANSLSRSVVMYACNRNVDLAIQHGRQRPTALPRSSSILVGLGQGKACSNSLRLSIFTPNVLMISKHADGSLNQWAVSFAEGSAFSTVLSVSHKSRYCGHRFHLNDLACHSLLPLLLTTSHHNALRTPEVDSVQSLPGPLPASRRSRVSLGTVSQDPNAIYSELILWRVDPVGPLSFSGGVSELARINSLHASAFSNVAWLPSLIPSSCLGLYGDSPSACFVASDGHSLRLYQAVIEAKKLLSELSNPEISCYLLPPQQGKQTQLLHVFEENLILGNEKRDDGSQELPTTQSASTSTLFSARFFLVVMEFTQSGRSLLHMWHLQLAAIPVAMGHLSSSSLQPAGRAPYLLATSCSDGTMRFWTCSTACDDYIPDTLTYAWEEWPLLVEEGLPNSSAVSIPGRPVGISCCHTSRVAVAYRGAKSLGLAAREPLLHVSIFQCESTGGSQWMLEQTLKLDGSSSLTGNSSDHLTLPSLQENLVVTGECMGSSGKGLVHLDWVSREDGSHILTVGLGSKLYMYGTLSGKPPELGLSDSSRECSSSRLVLLRIVDLVSSVEGSLPIPVSLSWVRDGILVVGMDCEMHVYSQWQPPAPAKSGLTTCDTNVGSVNSITGAVKQEGSNLQPPKKTLMRSMTSLAQKLSGKRTMYDLPAEMEDYGLFEAAHHLFPTLPQYHPVQLLELMDLGKVRRAKAILSHLVKCIAGEIVALKDATDNQERRLRSLSISASGSTARDPKMFNKAENADYTEIDSVPPLPLYALLAADEEITPKAKDKTSSVSGDSGHGSSRTDTYDELFQATTLSMDDMDPLDGEDEDASAKVIDLSQYSPTFFGLEHAQVLSSHLLHSSLPGLTRMEQMSLMALADTVASTSTDIGESQEKSQGGETLDECGLKFLLAVRLHTFLLTSLPLAHRAQLLCQGLSTCHYAWAFHSEAEEELLNMLPALQKGEPTWPELRAMGVGWWLRSTNKLRRCIEKVAKASFQRNNDPLDAALFYLAMKKKAVVWGLYRSHKNTKMTAFFSNNFSEDRWRKAALKNAFSLLGKQRFQHSAAFFLLAGSLKDAVEVCLEKIQDLQLALVISRLYESEFETSSTYKKILQRYVLGEDRQIPMHQDPFLRSMAYWVLEDYSRALDTLLEQPKLDASHQGSTTSPCNPAVFNFYTYLRTHPLLLRRHFVSSDKAKVGLTAEGRMADSISLVERRLFFTAANAHLQAGCPMLALEVLSKMPKVVKRSKLLRKQEKPSPSLTGSCSPPSKSRKEQGSALDWSQPDLNGFESVSDTLSSSREDHSHSDSVLSFDWSQPSMTLQDEPLELKWDSDKEDSEDEEAGLAMKNIQPEIAAVSLSAPNSTSASLDAELDDPPILSVDILAARLKFISCLKILTAELRTLSTGYELDGGKLRSQLCHWLEREVMALQRCCGYNPNLQQLPGGISADLVQDVGEEQRAEGTAEQARKVQHWRRLWLQRNQPLLRIFLSYCSLHGSHGGGLASVRMELILLLQQSQQDDSPQVSVQQQASVPLLLACTASSKTVVANPIVHLTNLTHDILHTINTLDSPPHPDVINNEIYVMHTLAASLSACIYQCLCDGHDYSHINQFTGTVYQSILLSHQHPLRTLSMDEAVLPNTSPAQWPGISALMRLLSNAGEENQPGLGMLLCEILTAVFLSLFVHGLATHSSLKLFRIAAHSLNSKLWVAVFGGGAHLPVVDKASSSSVPATLEEQERKQRRFKLRSSRSSSREAQDSPASRGPVLEQDVSVLKERFVPPELSIWDYFIAKPFLPLSASQGEYDSEESQGSEEEEEEEEEDKEEDEIGESFDAISPLQEHSNNNSYSWCLMRLAMVQLVLVNLKSFYPIAGHDLLDLPVSSPLCHAVLKTLQRWEQVLLKRLEIFGGPPSNYISTHATDEAVSSGPALLRHKSLLEPTNTPFRSRHRSALPVKRLWQFLVKREEVQDTFIRNIFTKKQDPNEVEADLGYPGGKARIIHKESDIITAFAINKANRNCLAIASTHDIQELDVSSILATQILTWVDDEAETEVKGSDDFLVVHARDDYSTLHGTTPYTHSSPGTPINMPWLGSHQTGRGAAMLIKRNINNVRRMTSHPTLPYYLTGAQDGSVRMFEWGHSQQIICFRSPGNSRVTRIRFNYQGNKFGIVDADGALSLWQTNTSGTAPKPYLTLQCHNKTAHDFVFVSSSSLIATAGLSTDNRNVCLWDTLVAPSSSLVHGFSCHESGATVLVLAPRQQLLISGGRKGWISVLDLMQKLQRQCFQAHDSPVKALAVDATEDRFVSGSAEGNIKVWSMSTQCLLHTFPNEHARQSIFRNLGTGVMQVEMAPGNHVFSCGADGTMKMRVLPDCFSAHGNNIKSDVRFIM